VQAVEKGEVHLFGHGVEEMASPLDRLDIPVNIAHKNDRSLGGNDLPPPAELSVLHVVLADIDDLFVLEPPTGHLIEGHHIPEGNQPFLA